MCPVHSIFRFLVKVTIKRKSAVIFIGFNIFIYTLLKRVQTKFGFFIRKKNEEWKGLDNDHNFSYQFFQKQWHPLVRPYIVYRNAYLLWKLSQPINIILLTWQYNQSFQKYQGDISNIQFFRSEGVSLAWVQKVSFCALIFLSFLALHINQQRHSLSLFFLHQKKNHEKNI